MRIYAKFAAYLLVALMFSTARAGAYEDFFLAVQRDDPRTVTRLLERGFDPNSVDPQGQSALYVALREPSLKVVEALWQAPGLKLDEPNGVGETPLMMACLRGHLDWIRRLLDRGAALHRPGWSPVHYAASAPESPDALELLLRRGAPVDPRSPQGQTPLMMAARWGDQRSADVLLAAGADPTLRDARELDAADHAERAGRDRLAARLRALAAGRGAR